MSLVLQSTSGGSITINEPATASNFTQTLPAASGEVMVSGNQPAFSVYLASTQTISINTWTKVTLNTEVFDTNSNFDPTTNYRFTPTIAGYYQISWCVFNSGAAFNGYSQLYKNGTGVAYGGTSQPSGGVTSQLTAGSYLVSMNGTTDYLELYNYAGVTTITGGSTVTYMTGVLARSL